MGGSLGKCCKKEKRQVPGNGGEEPRESGGARIDIQLKDIDLDNFNYLKDTLHNDLELFVINNALLSVQFFNNFDEEIEELRKASESEGAILDGHRIRQHQADKLMDVVGTHVVFRPRHGPQKNTEALLHPLRSFLVYQNIAVEEERHDSEEETQEAPFYKFMVEELDGSLRHAGLMNLKKTYGTQTESIYERIGGEKGGTEDPEDHYESMDKFRKSVAFSASAANVNNDYAYVLGLTSTKNLYDVRPKRRPTCGCELHSSTFTDIQRKWFNTERRTGLQGPPLTTVTYLSSSAFVHHFFDVLAVILAKPLSLPFERAKVQGARICVDSGIVTHHIVPVLQTKRWPEQGSEFNRPPNPNQKYAWPTRQMQRKVRRTGAYILPLGNLQRTGKDPNFELQWRFITPRAEEILMTYTMHSHVRCYLFTMVILKSFVKAEESCLGLEHTHILHLLFWQIHENFENWPEDRPAENLMIFLRVIYNAIRNRKVKDFFIRDRNLLESSPLGSLHKAQGMLAKISENPLSYILLALKNLRMRPSFYPELDFSHVYKLATTKNVLQYLNPQVVPKRRESTAFDLNDADEEWLWRKQMLESINKDKAAKEEEAARRESVETIIADTNAVEDGDALRRTELLLTFLPHFFAMGKKSRENNAIDQAKLYFTHVENLARLLREESGYHHDTNEWFRRVDEEYDLCDKQEDGTLKGSYKDPRFEEIYNDSKGHRLSMHDRDLPELPDDVTSL